MWRCIVVPLPSVRAASRRSLAFGLGGFAAGSALRQVVLATRRQGWRGLVGRANGGMIVHLGVVIVAVAVAASQSYAKVAEVKLKPNESAVVHGHTITYLGMETVQESNRITQKARMQVDGDGVFAPALQSYDRGDEVATPSVRAGLKATSTSASISHRPRAAARWA